MDYKAMKIKGWGGVRMSYGSTGIEATACATEPHTVYGEYMRLKEAAEKLKIMLADLERVICGGSIPAEDHGFGEGFPGALNNTRQDIETATASAHRIWVTFGMEKEVGNAPLR